MVSEKLKEEKSEIETLLIIICVALGPKMYKSIPCATVHFVRHHLKERFATSTTQIIFLFDYNTA